MGKLKPGWKRVKLGEIIERHVERVEDVTTYSRFVGVDDLDTGDLRLRRHGTVGVDELPPTFRYAFRTGMILVPTRRPRLRKCAVAPFEGLTGEKILVLNAKEGSGLHPLFAQYLLSSPRVQDWNIESEVGSVTPHFRWGDMSECEVALPPMEEQRVWAHRLRVVDEAGFALEQVRDSAVLARRALSRELFDRREGEQRKLSTLITDSRYGPRFGAELYDSAGPVAQLRTTDIDTEGNINYDTIPRVALNPDEFAAHFLKDRDLVISRSGTCGLTAVFREQGIPTIAAAFLIRLRTREELLPAYLHEFLSSPQGRALTTSLARGGVQKNINGSELLEQTLFVPSVERQEEVIELLDAARQAETAAHERLAQWRKMKTTVLARREGCAS